MKNKKDLNSVKSITKQLDMYITQIEIKILHKINENKEGWLLVNLAKALKINRSNLSKYVNELIKKGIVIEVEKYPKIVKIANLNYLGNLHLVECWKCKVIKIIPKTQNYFKCEQCKSSVKVKGVQREIVKETDEKLMGLMYSLQLKGITFKNFDKFMDYIVNKVCKIQQKENGKQI